jgi:hypothetical protein
LTNIGNEGVKKSFFTNFTHFLFPRRKWLKKICVRASIIYHYSVSITLNLIASEPAFGFTLKWKSAIHKFGATARLKAGAGGRSALQLYVDRISPNLGTRRQWLEGTAPLKCVPIIVVIMDNQNTLHTAIEIGMGTGVGEMHIAG